MKNRKLPTITEIRARLVSLKSDIGDDYRASDDSDDTLPGMCVTIGCTPGRWDKDSFPKEFIPCSWSYQTGDNSFTGGAYGHPDWAVVSLYRRSNCTELARDVINQLAELSAY